jgi:hypothetical protein
MENEKIKKWAINWLYALDAMRRINETEGKPYQVSPDGAYKMLLEAENILKEIKKYD